MANHIFTAQGKKQTIDQLLAGDDKDIWSTSTANELGRLSSGIIGRVKGSGTIHFIKRHTVPKNKKVTYANFVCDHRPLKEEKHRVRLTIGGDRLEYTSETASPAASLLETKMLVNSTISDAHLGARFMTIDISNFFLQTILPEKDREYMRIHSKHFNEEFRTLYKINNIIADDGYVYCEILKGMYGLKQAAILAYLQLKKKTATTWI
jgi:hypothetical protein